VARGRILLVEDEPSARAAVARFLRAKGYEVEAAETCRAAEDAFRSALPDVVLLDQVLPDGDGVALLARLKAHAPGVPVIVFTGHGSIEIAVRAIKEGAEQFLTKPVDMAAVLILLERLRQNQRGRRQQLAGHSRDARGSVDPFLGTSAAITALAEEARRIAPAESAVLIQGETGSGKGVLARWLHENGPRADEAFVDLNCAGLSKDLLETELFGHEAGAFTGALKAKLGLIEIAHRGTLFLDEIADMDPLVQPKLLKVLEERRFRAVGDVRDRYSDLRLISASHQDMAARAQQGTFRSDLFFRVNTLTLTVPPLRERAEDIELLAEHVIERLAREMGRGPLRLARESAAALQEYAWPGNVRELRNVLERAVLLCQGDVIHPSDLRFTFARRADAPAEGESLEPLREVERRHLQRVVQALGGNMERAARTLEISKSSLYERMKRFRIPPFDS
jgi:DNA-binding NtrC family response regulator